MTGRLAYYGGGLCLPRQKSTEAMLRERDREKARRAEMEQRGSRRVRAMIDDETEQQERVERELIGSAGHWIENRGVAGDGREKLALFDPNGVFLCMKWGKSAAEAAIRQLVETGSISR
jgi:hypothetical protein